MGQKTKNLASILARCCKTLRSKHKQNTLWYFWFLSTGSFVSGTPSFYMLVILEYPLFSSFFSPIFQLFTFLYNNLIYFFNFNISVENFSSAITFLICKDIFYSSHLKKNNTFFCFWKHSILSNSGDISDKDSNTDQNTSGNLFLLLFYAYVYMSILCLFYTLY